MEWDYRYFATEAKNSFLSLISAFLKFLRVSLINIQGQKYWLMLQLISYRRKLWTTIVDTFGFVTSWSNA